MADVFYDYGSERGYIVVDRSVLLRYLPDPAPSSIGVYVASGTDPAYSTGGELKKSLSDIT